MMEYTSEDLLRLAKRHHNTKRTYLLVDPLQGKHIPVSPGRALDMMAALGEKLRDAYDDIDIVIGFAETATAVGAAVAHALKRPVFYLTTTREPFATSHPHITFEEEHSHASAQYLLTEGFLEHIGSARRVAFVDDELSTGKTLVNIVKSLRQSCPALDRVPMVAVSIINRLSAEREAFLAENGMESVSLLHLPMEDLTEKVERFEIRGGEAVNASADFERLRSREALPDMRRGGDINEIFSRTKRANDDLLEMLRPRIADRRVVVLGTEETMWPGLLLGKAIEDAHIARQVLFHATTRSPIGICDAPSYPIRSGFRLESFYEAGRPTFIYDLMPCDVVIVRTDAGHNAQFERAAHQLSAAFATSGCPECIIC